MIDTPTKDQNKNTTVAMVYDFDGTLASGDMQDTLIKDLGMSPKNFWNEKDKLARNKDIDNILAYMYLLIYKAKEKGFITRGKLEEYGSKLKFFQGVEGWFERINTFGDNYGIEVKHYIVSCGLREMISASPIGKELDHIWAASFMYGEDGKAIWPALSVNYTTKVQYLFRINKGVLNSYDDELVNKDMLPEKRPIPFSNMVYIGDGDTDIPSMKMTVHKGGQAIAVYDPNQQNKKESCKLLKLRKCVDYYAEADYREGKGLDLIIKDILSYIGTRSHSITY